MKVVVAQARAKVANESINRGNKVENFEASESRKPLSNIYVVIRIPRIYA